MKQVFFLTESRKLLSQRSWHWIIVALRQDTVVFKSLMNSDFGKLALETLSAEPEDWSPASLSMLALENPATLADLIALPLEPLPKRLRGLVARTYEDWLNGPDITITLQKAGLLALSLRERLRLTGSWDGLVEELRELVISSRTVLACLYGMIPEPSELLNALLEQNGNPPKPNLALHAFLSNPLPAELQVEVLRFLLKKQSLSVQMAVMSRLSIERPWLASKVGEDILEEINLESLLDTDVANINPDEQYASDLFLDEQAKRLTRLFRIARIYEHADRSNEAIPVLSESINITNRLHARLEANLAKAVSSRSSDNGRSDKVLDYWKQATQLASNMPQYAAGLVNALVESGRLDDAKAYLEARQVDTLLPLHSILPLTAARVAQKMDDPATTYQAAQRAFELLSDQCSLDQNEFLMLAEILAQTEQIEEAEKVAQSGVRKYANDTHLLSFLAGTQLQYSKQQDALENAYLAFAVDMVSSNKPGPDNYDASIQRILVNSLEQNGDWQAALEERILLVEQLETPAPSDYHDIMYCALQAEHPKQAIDISKLALELNPEDGEAYSLIGKAYLVLEDIPAAVDNLRMATSFEPELADAWIALAGAYKLDGKGSKYFETLNAACLAAPIAPEVHFALGEAHLERNALTQALDSLRKASALLAPASSTSKLEGENHPAVELKAFEVNFDLATNISYRFGQTLKELGYPKEALQVLETAYQAAVNSENRLTKGAEEVLPGRLDPALAYLYANTLIAIEKYEPAVEALEYVVRFQPERPEPAMDFARILLLLDPSPEQARKVISILKCAFHFNDGGIIEYEKVIEKTTVGQRAEAQALFAEALAVAGEYVNAKTVFRTALDTQIINEPAWLLRLSIGLSRVAMILDEPELALASLQEAVKLDNENPAVFRSISDAYLATGLIDESYQAAKTALELDSDERENSIWFAEYMQELSEQPGVGNQEYQEQAIDALETVIRFEPSRPDFVIRLADLQRKVGDKTSALETYKKFAKLDNLVGSASEPDILGAAQCLADLDEPRIAIDLLESVIEQSKSDENDGSESSHLDLSGFYLELANIYHIIGEFGQAANTVERAIEADPQNPELYIKKICLLKEMQDTRSAIENTERALSLFPANSMLNQTAAMLHYKEGELSKAVQYSEIAISALGKSDIDKNSDLALLRAAELARAALEPERSLSYLSDINLGKETIGGLEGACLKAEAALDIGDNQSAVEALQEAQKFNPGYPRVMAIHARLLGEKEEISKAVNLLSTLKQELEDFEVDGESQEDNLIPLHPYMNYRAVGEACLALGDWETAVELLSHVAKRVPQEPISHMQLAQALVLRAETQKFSQMMQIKNHAPGCKALEDEARVSFEEALNEVEKRVGELVNNDDNQAARSESEKAIHTAVIWRARGHAVFTPNTENAKDLQRTLFNSDPDPELLAAYYLVLRDIGDHTKIKEVTGGDWRFLSNGSNIGEHPLILSLLALLQAEDNPERALENAILSVKKVVEGRNPRLLQPPMANYLLAKLAFQNEEFSLALGAVQSALEIWPDEPNWCALASEIFRSRDEKIGLPDLSEAVKYLEKAVKLEPKQMPLYMHLGQVYLESGDSVQAMQVLEQATRLNPDHSEAWVQLAEAQLAAGRLDLAVESTNQALENADNPIKPLLLLGEIELQSGNPKSAYKIVQSVLSIEPDHSDALLLLIRILVSLDRSEEAIEILEAAIPSVTDPLPIQLELTRLTGQVQGQEAALPLLQGLSEQYPGQPNVLALMAKFLLEQEEFGQAVIAAKQALLSVNGELSAEEKSELNYLVGRQSRDAGQLDQAVHYLSLAIQHDPNQVESYLELGQVYQDRRQHQDALSTYQKAINLSPEDYQSYYLAGLALKDGKDYAGAENMLRRASQLAPDEPHVHRLLSAVAALNLIHNHQLVPKEITTL
ncbi:tetratricopeptide repeat protein [Chloroflexota bacterium]